MKKEEVKDYLIFQINGHKCAAPISCIEKVLQIAAVQTIPNMPMFLHGIINCYGEMIPVINIHYLFGYNFKGFELSQHLIVVNIKGRKLALLVENTEGVVEIDTLDIQNSSSFMCFKKVVKGIVQLSDGMILINDFENYFAERELNEIDELLKNSKKKVAV